ncbi:MAG: hypothetical protein ACK55I_14565, partial [bacterium]
VKPRALERSLSGWRAGTLRRRVEVRMLVVVPPVVRHITTRYLILGSAVHSTGYWCVIVL